MWWIERQRVRRGCNPLTLEPEISIEECTARERKGEEGKGKEGKSIGSRFLIEIVWVGH